jgi:hypothetical protein
MQKDTTELFKYSFITVLLIAGWFGLTALSRNIVVQILLAWAGLAVVALYWRWLKRNKVKSTKS